MRYLKLFVVIIFPGMLFISCDPCTYECEPSIYNGSFRIVSATTGEDLVFGPAKIYDKDQIKFYSLKNTDTTFFEVKWTWTLNDSIMLVAFAPRTDTAYIRLSNSDVDTLKISYNSFERCCGTITEITNFRMNDSVDIPGNQGTQVIKK